MGSVVAGVTGVETVAARTRCDLMGGAEVLARVRVVVCVRVVAREEVVGGGENVAKIRQWRRISVGSFFCIGGGM